MRDKLYPPNLRCPACSNELIEVSSHFNQSKVILQCKGCASHFKIYPRPEIAHKYMIKKRNIILIALIGIGLINGYQQYSSGDLAFAILLMSINVFGALIFYIITLKMKPSLPDNVTYNELLTLNSEESKKLKQE